MSIRIAAASFVLVVTAAPALAADRKVPSVTTPTIAAAVALAGPGDRILVAPGVYQENVVSTVADLQIVGKNAVWDGTLTDGTAGVCLTASGGGTVVTGFTFRAGLPVAAQVQLTGDGCRVSKCVSRGPSARFLKVVGNRLLLESCRLFAVNSTAVEVIGDDAVVRKLTVRLGDDAVVKITGARATVSGNSFHAVEDSYSVDVAGADAVVSSNSFRNCDNSVHVVGDGMTVVNNRISAWRVGMTLVGDRLTVRGNTLVAAAGGGGNGIDASSSTVAGGGTIERNSVTFGLASGFSVSTNGVTVRGNRAVRCGTSSSAGFLVSGSGNSLDSNTAIGCGSRGFDLSGTSTVVRRCAAKGSTGDGFRVGGTGVSLEACRASGNSGEGLDNRGTDTRVTSSRFLKNRLDVANSGTFAVFDGTNVFATGGALQDPQVD